MLESKVSEGGSSFLTPGDLTCAVGGPARVRPGGRAAREARTLLQACPTMPATVIVERIAWPYSIRTLSGQVAELRPIYMPPDPASRTSVFFFFFFFFF